MNAAVRSPVHQKLSKEQELEKLLERYSSDLVSLADRLEAFSDEPKSPIRRQIAHDYKVTAEAFLVASGELKLLRGQPLTNAERQQLQKEGILK